MLSQSRAIPHPVVLGKRACQRDDTSRLHCLIVFLAMQVGVHPRTLGTFVLLRSFVCSRPVSLGIPPESEQGESKPRRWLGPLE